MTPMRVLVVLSLLALAALPLSGGAVALPSLPWLLIGVGFVMLLAAGFVMVRYETSLRQPEE